MEECDERVKVAVVHQLHQLGHQTVDVLTLWSMSHTAEGALIDSTYLQ